MTSMKTIELELQIKLNDKMLKLGYITEPMHRQVKRKLMKNLTKSYADDKILCSEMKQSKEYSV